MRTGDMASRRNGSVNRQPIRSNRLIVGSRRHLLRILIAATIAAFAMAHAATAQANTASQDQAAIRAALTQWMDDFNAGRADKVCGLFAKDVIATYRGQPERDHAALCGLLRRSLADPKRRFRYALMIKEIIVEGDLAVVRLVWTLTVSPRTPPRPTAKTTAADKATVDVTTEEPGMDIFRRQPDGSWKIVRYLAFEDEKNNGRR